MKKKITNNPTEDEIKNAADYCFSHNDILKEIGGLTLYKLQEDLKEAVTYNKGYFKNDKGEFRHIKGIEVTNDTSNLCRMGFNGEDRGVWVHYCEVDDKRVIYHDMPINSFLYFLNPFCRTEDEVFKPTTKEEFDEQVKKTISNIISDYTETRPAEEYLEFVNSLTKIMPYLD